MYRECAAPQQYHFSGDWVAQEAFCIFFGAIGLFKIPYCPAKYLYRAYNEYDYKLSARVLVLQISFPIAVPA